ncbi:conserved hypothetical protein [Leishmania major strain Friedlin]|uniref:Uncharacterized protein n=1 Tax=Leishmania major TaxID=5664 RepID=Q4QEE1_LEIMA|nr:conserved hypothetical protein [Leishmania major strain Friedlin]CAG9572278.1 hypothetical_protein_-_conserved [Leishmania major strain Friedlin]CAJ03563.1 conserved hypothetical protein [Leishmania major strain Friedlin]|eukprot:XP_001682307.1 conserved hypothetical protein [Leishmania major strain Friedlin]
MAHLLDSVASPSSTSPSQTPTRSSSSLQSHKAAHPSSRQRHPPPQQRWSSSAQVAAHPMRRANVEERVGGSPEWDRRTPTRQQQSHRSAQRGDPLPASRRVQQERATTTEEAAATYTSPISVDDEASSRFSATQLTEMRERYGSDWASPSEVLQLRTLFQDVMSRYVREVQALKGELAKAQEECTAYAREREKVLELQQVYQDGVAACGRAKEREAQWVEERALLHVQMEKMMVENQRLQLYIAKKQQPHTHHMPPRGSATGSRERVRAAVQAVATATAATSSASPSPSASWPPLPPTATATTTNTTAYLASPQPLDGPDTKIAASLPSAAGAAVTGTVHTEATSPYTLPAPSSPEVLQHRAPQRGGGVAAETTLPPMPSPTSHQSSFARSASPMSAAGAAGAQPLHSTPPQRTFPTGTGDDAGADLPGGDGDHGDTLPQQQRGRSRRHPRGGANHDEEPHNSSLMTPSASTSDDGRLGAGKAVRLPRQQRVRLDGGDDEVDNTIGEGEFNPSYARGVTDLSSTSGGSSSPSPAADMRAMLAGCGLAQVHEQRSGGHSDGGGRRAAEQWGGEPVAERSAAVAAAGELPATATATATTTTTPSLGSTAMMTASSSLSLQYLYQLPRTPAEALQEEVQMLKELRRLGEENQVLKARLDYMQMTKEIFTNQCEQQHLRLAQAHDQSRHSAAQWELSSRQLESEVRQSEAKCAELQGALEDVLQRAKRQQELSQARLVELEASSRAALVTTRDEAMGRVGALRSSLREIAASLATKSASETSPAAGHEVAQLREEAGQRERIVENLRSELHALRAAHTELQDDHSALQAEAQMYRTRLEGDLASSRELLATARSGQQSAESRIDELEAEVERLRSAVVASDGCMHTMEERLRLATDELASQQEQLDEASTWQARALSAESELGTQRSYYEKEIAVYKTAACAMQDRHHAEVEGLLKRYEKLQVRHEATKVRLAAAVSRSGAAAVFAAAGGQAKRRHSRHAKSEDRGVPVISGNPTDAASHSPSAAVKTEASSSHCATAAYDSLQALRTSGQVTEKLIRSLNRATSPYH